MIYILLNLDTANYEGTFRSEADALVEVRYAVERFGHAYAAGWTLGRRDDSGDLSAIAEGDELIDRAFGVASARQSNS